MDQDINFCSNCGTRLELRTVFGKERPACPACGWVYFADPKVAVAVLVEKEGKVLLTRRINDPERGKWSLPAGFMDAYETPEQAAERECLEETGFQVAITGLVDVLGGREHPNGADVFILYRAVIVGGDLKAGDDADQVGFFNRNALPALAFKTTRKALGQSMIP
ncbi:MAG: NUDIX hydrolase [Anaerolineaceae bacterium]|jgi:ADP-ribose pyrophosphatase YjhB (NUDIX family)